MYRKDKKGKWTKRTGQKGQGDFVHKMCPFCPFVPKNLSFLSILTLLYYSTGKSGEKCYKFETNLLQRFLNGFGSIGMSSMNNELFQNFHRGEVPLFATFLPLFYHFLISLISPVLKVGKSPDFVWSVCLMKGYNFLHHDFVVR